MGERLDAEALHEVKERYFSAMAAEITRHGGKIEKYIGDAIMAVFGLPRAHEDDALRAVRAAAGMQAALGRVNEDLQRSLWRHARQSHRRQHRRGCRHHDPNAQQKLATGDAVHVAARLEQSTVAGKYTVEASALGYKSQSVAKDISAANASRTSR